MGYIRNIVRYTHLFLCMFVLFLSISSCLPFKLPLLHHLEGYYCYVWYIYEVYSLFHLFTLFIASMNFTFESFRSSPLTILHSLVDEASKTGKYTPQKLASSDVGFVSEFLKSVSDVGMDHMAQVRHTRVEF